MKHAADNQMRRALALFALAAVLCGCGLRKNLVSPGCNATVPGSSNAAAQNPGLQAFVQQVYPLFSSPSRCAQCHVSGGQTPDLGDISDSGNSYRASKQYLNNLKAPKSSLLYTMASNGHCQLSNCMDADGAVGAAITAWAQGELTPSTTTTAADGTCQIAAVATPTPAPGTPGGFGSGTWKSVGSIALDNQVQDKNGNAFSFAPTDTTTVGYLSYDLTAFGASNALLIFRIKRYSTSAYIISDPTLLSAQPYHITGMHLYVENAAKEKSVELATFDDESTDVVASSTFPGTPIDTRFAIALAQGTTGDSVRLGIGAISAPNGVTNIPNGNPAQFSCTNVNGPNGFKTLVIPIISAICSHCHAPGLGTPAEAVFVQDPNDPAGTCARWKIKMPAAPYNGAIVIQNPTGHNMHYNLTDASVAGVVNARAFTNADIANIILWRTNEP